MHELGLAADLVGDFAWLGNDVGRFGLMTFADVNSEPWHVQPVELPKGRKQYEQQGSKWGAFPTYDKGSAPSSGGAARAQPSSAGTGPGVVSDAARPALPPALVARLGDIGPAARVLMEALVARGLRPDAPASRDREYGTDDKELVLEFQREHDLVADGEVGPHTWSKLLSTVKPGDTGPMVKVLQTTLTLDDPLTRGVGEFGDDSSVANGSSVAFLFEVGGASLLLTGDAFASDLETTIGQLLAQRGVSKLHVDLFKLSHHGSRQNMTDGLLDLIDPGAILVCTDGSKFRHPDEDALDQIRSHYPEVPIHFTDDTEHIRQRATTVGALPRRYCTCGSSSGCARRPTHGITHGILVWTPSPSIGSMLERSCWSSSCSTW